MCIRDRAEAGGKMIKRQWFPSNRGSHRLFCLTDDSTLLPAVPRFSSHASFIKEQVLLHDARFRPELRERIPVSYTHLDVYKRQLPLYYGTAYAPDGADMCRRGLTSAPDALYFYTDIKTGAPKG